MSSFVGYSSIVSTEVKKIVGVAGAQLGARRSPVLSGDREGRRGGLVLAGRELIAAEVAERRGHVGFALPVVRLRIDRLTDDSVPGVVRPECPDVPGCLVEVARVVLHLPDFVLVEQVFRFRSIVSDGRLEDQPHRGRSPHFDGHVHPSRIPLPRAANRRM